MCMYVIFSSFLYVFSFSFEFVIYASVISSIMKFFVFIFFVVAIFSWGGERGRDRRVEDGGKEGDFIADNVHGPGNPHWEKLLII